MTYIYDESTKIGEEMTYLKRVSADLEEPANTNLLLVLCVRKGLIILEKARYHQGTLMKIYTNRNKTKSTKLSNDISH